MNKRLPEDFEDLTDEEQQEIISQLEDVVASVDPAALREEIAELTKLTNQARELEAWEVETKLNALKDLLTRQGVFADPDLPAGRQATGRDHRRTNDGATGLGCRSACRSAAVR
jgi:hypothetical protein